MNIPYLEDLQEKIKDKAIRVVSFDFFDTLMSRRVPHPKDIFLMLGEELSNANLLSFDIPPERFQSLRISAEQKARDLSTCKEINIRDIYNQFPADFFTISKEKAIELEVDVEKRFLFASADMIETVKLAHKRGKKVIVVSDIYLDAEHLKFFWGESTPGIDIEFYASSHYKTGKYDKLFDLVIKDLKCKPSSILHSGDNYISDCQSPSSKGIQTCFLPHGSATFWQNFDHETKHTNVNERMCNVHGDLGITAIRCKTMLHRRPTEIDREGYVRYGAQTLGPVFSPFVHWVNSVCIESKVDVILPLMREGYMIDKLLSSYTGANSKPAYFSRRVLFQATLTKADRSQLEALRFGNLDSSVSDYLELIGLYQSDAPELSSIFEEKISNNEHFKNLINVVIQTPRLIAKVRSRSEDMRRGILSHLKKLTNYSEGKPKVVALVDVGWNATIQKLLQHVVSEENLDIRLIGLYMMTTPAVNELMLNGVSAKGYYVDGGYPTPDFDTLSRTLEIFEQSCAPAHGSVLRHDIKSGEPILKPDLIPFEQRADINDIQDGILLFNNLYRRNVPENTSAKVLKTLAAKFRPILRRAMLAPTRQEAELFSNWVHDDNLAAANTMPILGSELSRDFIAHQTLRQFFEIPMSELYWPAGALALHDPAKSKIVALASLNSLPLDTFDTDVRASSELAATSESDSSFSSKNHQHVFRNSSGKTYLKFDLDVDRESIVRWTPIARPFDLKIDFAVLTYKAKDGLSTSIRIEGRKFLSNFATFTGMEQYDISSWRGIGEGCAFYIANLSKLGISSPSHLTLQIACSICTLDAPSLGSNLEDFDFNETSSIENGRSVIEKFDNVPATKGQTIFRTTSNTVNLSGWMLHNEFKNTQGYFYIRLTNPLGKAQFIQLNSIKRPDVAQHFQKEIAPNLQDNVGFSLTNYKVNPGKYTATIIRQCTDKSQYLVSSETWQLIVGDVQP